MRSFILILFFLGIVSTTKAQPDSCHLRISLITCSPGEELYSTFGHTAIRVIDSSSGLDIVYNYGTFEFSPRFYREFIQGKLLYYLSVQDFQDFLVSYQWESRTVVEQVLLLSCIEKINLHTSLKVNALPQNRYYRYDFLFDNCTTRAKEMIESQVRLPVHYKNILPADRPTFRDLIHTYLNIGGQYWSRLGIDMLLGAKLDKKVTTEQAMFLPDYLLQGFDSATVYGEPLVKPVETVLAMPSPLDKGSIFRPSFLFSFMFLIMAALSVMKKRWAFRLLHFLDILFFFTLGVAGCLMLFMWFGTDHIVCQNNYNLLWALPTHLIAAFLIRKKWMQSYFQIVFGISVIVAVAWFFLPQELHLSLLVILILIIFRSWNLGKKEIYGMDRNTNKAEKNTL